jgi:hypothetical protein
MSGWSHFNGGDYTATVPQFIIDEDLFIHGTGPRFIETIQIDSSAAARFGEADGNASDPTPAIVAAVVMAVSNPPSFVRTVLNVLTTTKASSPYAAGGQSSARPDKGSTLPRDLREQLAIEQARSNPATGTPLPMGMNDPRWPGSAGWVKMRLSVKPGGAPIEVHYVRNVRTGQADDLRSSCPAHGHSPELQRCVYER